MKNNRRFYYLVEGECERKLIETFKEQKNLILPGKVLTFNAVQKRINPTFLRTIADETTIILVFDTDTDSIEILSNNITLLSENSHVKDVWCVMQVKNLEDELVRATDVDSVKCITGSKSNKDFKHDLIVEKHLYEKLSRHNFNFSKMWVSTPDGKFSAIKNSGERIKK